MGLLLIEWVKIGSKMTKCLDNKGFMSCQRPPQNGINKAWENIEDSGTLIPFVVFILNIAFQAFLVTPRLGLSGLSAGEKNGLWGLWLCSPYDLRSKDPKGSRSFLWRPAHLSGGGNSARLLPKMPKSETGKVGVVGRIPFLHQAVCLLCRATVSRVDHSRYRQGIAFELEDGQGLGKAVYAGAAASSQQSGAQGDWD